MKFASFLLWNLLGCLLLNSANAAEQGEFPEWNVSISGSQRARFSSLDNQFRPLLNGGDQALSLRTLLKVQADRGPLSLVAEIQDSRDFFNDNGSFLSTIEINALEPLQLYAAYRLQNMLVEGDSVDLKAGRFTTGFGSGRLVTRHGFRNTIQNYTGVQADWRSGAGPSLSVFWVMPGRMRPLLRQELLDNDIRLDKVGESLQLAGVFFSTPLATSGVSLESYLFTLQEEDEPDKFFTADRELFMPGLRIIRTPAPGRWDFELEAIYQWGSRRATPLPADTRTLDVSSSLVHVAVGHSFKARWQPRLSLEFTRASGDKQPGDNRFERFDRLFGPRREFGPTGIFGMLGHSNLQSTALRLEVAGSRTDWMVSVRDNRLVSATDSFATSQVRDVTGASGRDAGIQWEFRVGHWLKPQRLRLETGGALFRNGDFMDRSPLATGEGNPGYLYADLTFLF